MDWQTLRVFQAWFLSGIKVLPSRIYSPAAPQGRSSSFRIQFRKLAEIYMSYSYTNVSTSPRPEPPGIYPHRFSGTLPAMPAPHPWLLGSASLHPHSGPLRPHSAHQTLLARAEPHRGNICRAWKSLICLSRTPFLSLSIQRWLLARRNFVTSLPPTQGTFANV